MRFGTHLLSLSVSWLQESGKKVSGASKETTVYSCCSISNNRNELR